MKYNKKGSHVGMILSFVIFITFLIFLYVVVRPSIDTGTNKGDVIDYIENEIIENTSSTLTTTSIEIDSDVKMKRDCITIQLLFFRLAMPSNVTIKNESGAIQETYVNVNYEGPSINRKSQDNLFFRIYYSPEFEPLPAQGTLLTCQPIYESEYSLGLVKTEDYIFEKNMLELIDYYNNYYEALKTEFEVPPNNEFGFEFVKDDGTIIIADQETKSGEVYVEEIPIQYIDENANLKTGFINIKVW